MAEEPKSSLRTALDSIMGWPGQTQGGVQGGTTGVVPRTTDVVNLGTTSNISNVVPEAAPDPFADELASVRAQNNALAASLATPAPAATVAAPTSYTNTVTNISTPPANTSAVPYTVTKGTYTPGAYWKSPTTGANWFTPNQWSAPTTFSGAYVYPTSKPK